MASSEAADTVTNKKTALTKALVSKEETGLTHECGVFGCVATGEWPTQIDVAQVICLGLVALQHRYCTGFMQYERESQGKTYRAFSLLHKFLSYRAVTVKADNVLFISYWPAYMQLTF
jgi:hypothetical protein